MQVELYFCDLCSQFFEFKSTFERHKMRQRHKRLALRKELELETALWSGFASGNELDKEPNHDDHVAFSSSSSSTEVPQPSNCISTCSNTSMPSQTATCMNEEVPLEREDVELDQIEEIVDEYFQVTEQSKSDEGRDFEEHEEN